MPDWCISMPIKTISVRSWAHTCPSCETTFDIEEAEARMAPDAPLYVAPDEPPYSRFGAAFLKK